MRQALQCSSYSYRYISRDAKPTTLRLTVGIHKRHEQRDYCRHLGNFTAPRCGSHFVLAAGHPPFISVTSLSTTKPMDLVRHGDSQKRILDHRKCKGALRLQQSTQHEACNSRPPSDQHQYKKKISRAFKSHGSSGTPSI